MTDYKRLFILDMQQPFISRMPKMSKITQLVLALRCTGNIWSNNRNKGFVAWLQYMSDKTVCAEMGDCASNGERVFKQVKF